MAWSVPSDEAQKAVDETEEAIKVAEKAMGEASGGGFLMFFLCQSLGVHRQVYLLVSRWWVLVGFGGWDLGWMRSCHIQTHKRNVQLQQCRPSQHATVANEFKGFPVSVGVSLPSATHGITHRIVICRR